MSEMYDLDDVDMFDDDDIDEIHDGLEDDDPPVKWYHFEVGDRRKVVNLSLACLALLCWDQWWLDAYHKTPADVYRGICKYGLVSLVSEGLSIRLFGPSHENGPTIRLSDPAMYHLSCGVDCREKGGAR